VNFHAQDFSKRFHTMGDPAEAAFDLVYPKHHKLGLNRPPFYMGGMTLAMRYVPDRMLRDRFVECMGVGKDRLLKVKNEKVLALSAWQEIGDVSLFVWDSHAQHWYEDSLEAWRRQIDKLGVDGTFKNDNKPYRALHVDHFPSSPQDLPTDAS